MGIFKKLTGAALACTMLTGAAVAQDMTFFRIGTGGAGGTYFPIGGIIANAISNPPGSRSCDEGATAACRVWWRWRSRPTPRPIT